MCSLQKLSVFVITVLVRDQRWHLPPSPPRAVFETVKGELRSHTAAVSACDCAYSPR